MTGRGREPFELERTIAGVRAAIDKMKADPERADRLTWGQHDGVHPGAEEVLAGHAAHAELKLGHCVEGTPGRPDEEWLIELAEIAGRACDLVRDKKAAG